MATPSPDSKKLGIFLDLDMHRRLRVAVSKHGLTNQDALLPCIIQRIEELEKLEPIGTVPRAKAKAIA